MKKFILNTVLFFCLLSFGQTPISKIIYLDSLGKETILKDCSFKEIIKEYNIEKPIYEVEYFIKSQEKFILKSKFFVNDKEKLTHHGACIYYYESGKTYRIKQYDNGQPINSKSWYENGNLESERKYFYDDKAKQYSFLTLNYWDENNIQKVINGTGVLKERIRENDTLFFAGNVKNGLKDGLWKSTSDNYPKVEEIYENGVFQNGVLYKSETKFRSYSPKNFRAVPVCGIQEFMIQLRKRLNNVKFKVKPNSKITIKFVVDENGKLSNFKTDTDLPEKITSELIAILSSISVWESGIFRGKETKQNFSLPIVFKEIELD